MLGFGFSFVFFAGLCMGAADLVPGISGGTVAFILGIYEELIDALRSVKLKHLLKFNFRKFFREIRFRFLLSLIVGIALSFITLSHLITFLLQHEFYRTLLYSAFFGLVLSSAYLLGRRIKPWRGKEICALVAGGIIAYFLTDPSLKYKFNPVTNSYQLFNFWLIFCGAIAISAMLLPGISGSYLLIILGVYPIAIEALNDFLSSLKVFDFDIKSATILGNLLVGIFLGAVLFSKAISWLLKNFQKTTYALLTGFMIGALKTVWPFWSYTYLPHPFNPDKGQILTLLHPIFPDLKAALFWESLFSSALCFVSVQFMELLVRKKFPCNSQNFIQS